MNREKQLVKNTFIVALGKICTQFISFFLLPLYTAILSTEEYGVVDLLNTYISLIIPIVFLQMDQAIFRFLIDERKNEENKIKLISTSLTTVFFQAILYLIIYIFIGRFINNEYKYFLATNVVATMLSGILLQICRGLGDNTTYSLGSIVSGAGTIIFNVLFIVVFKWGAYGMLSATLLANISCSIFIIFKKKIYKYYKIKKYTKEIRKELWKYSIPMVPNMLSWWIVNASDRTIVTYFLGVGENGIYSAANKFSAIIITLFNVFNLTWSESASLYINDKDRDIYFSKIMNKAIKFSTTLCFGLIAIMPFVFNYLITGQGYSSAYQQIPILIISTLFNIVVSLIGSVYVGLKKSKEIAKTSIIAAIINIGVNLVLVNSIGLYAASISTLIAYLSMAIYRYIDVRKYVKISFDLKHILLSVIIGIIIITLYYIRNSYLCLLSVIIIIIYAIYYNVDIILDLIKLIKRKVGRN